MKLLLCFPLGPIPWSLATADGSVRKTNKAALTASITNKIPLADAVPANSATVIDGMALVRRLTLDTQHTTFDEVAERLFAMAINDAAHSRRIDVVFDTYQHMSIKNMERARRCAEPGLKVKNATAGQMIKQWKKFMSADENKVALIKFLSEEWQTEKYRAKLGRLKKVLYVTCEDVCHRITGLRCRQVLELQCSQEEADGRLLLHAKHAAEERFDAVVISADDTDVFLLSLAFSWEIRPTRLFQKTGTRARTHMLDINTIADSLGRDVCIGLLGMHAFTGCDSVSAFAGKGKLSALKILKEDEEARQAFIELGQSWDVTEELFLKLQKITCRLYSKQGPQEVNKLRYYMYCEKNGEIEPHLLPTCEDVLHQHTKRANYQTALWRRCLMQDPEAPDPTQHGWRLENKDGTDVLVINWMTIKPAPDAIIELLACTCSRACTAADCCCMQNSLKCTEMCRLRDCENQAVDDDLEDVSLFEDEDDDIEAGLFFDEY